MAGKTPIGVELVRRGLIKESDIEVALNYQKEHVVDILKSDALKGCTNDEIEMFINENGLMFLSSNIGTWEEPGTKLSPF